MFVLKYITGNLLTKAFTLPERSPIIMPGRQGEDGYYETLQPPRGGYARGRGAQGRDQVAQPLPRGQARGRTFRGTRGPSHQHINSEVVTRVEALITEVNMEVDITAIPNFTQEAGLIEAEPEVVIEVVIEGDHGGDQVEEGGPMTTEIIEETTNDHIPMLTVVRFLLLLVVSLWMMQEQTTMTTTGKTGGKTTKLTRNVQDVPTPDYEVRVPYTRDDDHGSKRKQQNKQNAKTQKRVDSEPKR